MQSMPPAGSRVAIYSRYSTSLQSFTSIEGQERLCVGYAQKHNWIVVARYSDAERSGTTTIGREGLFQMLAAAERGEFDILLVEDIDRTSRDAADMHRIAKDLEELDIVFCTVANGVVTDMELAFKAVQNQQYVKQNAFKSKRGQELVVANGRFSGSVPYGYRKVPKFDDKGEPINGLRAIDEATAAVVLRIHEDFDAGKSTFEICAALNAEGVPSPKGKLWRPGSLLGNRHGGIGILRNPIYIGEFQFRKTHRKRRKGVMKTRFTASHERMVTQHPDLAIIDRDLWDRNQARLAENFDKPFYAKKKVEYLFTGRVFCGSCGSTCSVSDGKFVCTGRQLKGVCDNARRVFREAVEDSVLSRMRNSLLSPGLLEPSLVAYRDEAERALADHAARTENDAVRLKEIDQKLSNLLAHLGATDEASFTSKMMLGEIETLGAEKTRLEHQMRQAPRPLGDALDTESIVKRIQATLDDLQKALESDDREAARAREIIRGLVTKLVLLPTPGTVADGRGAGDVTVTVEGPLAALIDLADLNINRVTKYGHRPMFILDNATSPFRFTYILEWRDPRLAVLYADLPIAAKLLDECRAPVNMDDLARAFKKRPHADSERTPEVRARYVAAYLQKHGYTRCNNTRSATTGYLWADALVADGEPGGVVDRAPRPISQLRIVPPSAAVVVIGGDASPAEETSVVAAATAEPIP